MDRPSAHGAPVPMLTLMLLRHAKAEPGGRDSDHERVLTDKGETDAKRLGSFCRDNALVPKRALVSGAARTRLTFDLLVCALGVPVPADVEEALYNATASEITLAVGRIASDCRTLLVVGHNPGIMEVAAMVARDGDLRERERLAGRFAPCALAVVTFPHEDWRDALASGGRLDHLVMPEDLAAAP